MSSSILSRRTLLAAGAATCAPHPGDAQTPGRLLTGVNLAGLEFASGRLPGRLDHDFASPTMAELDYYQSCGARVVRIPFLWERAQPMLGRDLDEAYVSLLDALIEGARTRGLSVILDAHQYGRRREGLTHHVIGEGDSVSTADFAGFWAALALRYRAHAHVIFGLNNEPHDQSMSILVSVMNATIAAIRATGSRNLILTSGNAWSGAHSWVSSGNAQAMLAIADPAENFAFDVHQYLDANSSGTLDACVAGAGDRLAPFTEWARQHRRRGFLGEFGAPADPLCATELSRLLENVAQSRDVWLGWTYWSGGPWWPSDYRHSIEPLSLRRPQDRPQMRVLRRYFQ